MNPTIETLRNEAKSNVVANAVFHVFALRKRARQNILLSSLAHRMKAEGFTFTRAQYADVMKVIAKVGLGTLQLDSKGKVKGLKDIKVTLQSIGVAACSATDRLSNFKQRSQFTTIVAKPYVITQSAPKRCEVHLSLEVGGKIVPIPVPKDLTVEDLAILIDRLRD